MVKSIWRATEDGQMKPSSNVPAFEHRAPYGRFAIEISFDDYQNLRLPASDQGIATIYTGTGSGFERLRTILV